MNNKTKQRKLKVSIITALLLILVTFMYTLKLTYNFNSKPTYNTALKDNPYKHSSNYNLDLTSKHVLAKKRGSSQIIFEKNAHQKTAQASLTKLTTILVALDYVDDWNALAPIDSESFKFLREQNSAMVGFYPGEKTTFLDLLYGSLLNSGGEAITSLAINAVGSEAEMIRLMNLKAEELNLQNTHYASVVGLDTLNHYSSAADLAIIFEAILEYPLIREIMETETKTTYTNAHPQGITMTSTVLPNIINDSTKAYKLIGGKSGTSYNAGLNWVILGEIDGEEYISVVMGAPWNKDLKQIEDTHKVFDFLALERFR